MSSDIRFSQLIGCDGAHLRQLCGNYQLTFAAAEAFQSLAAAARIVGYELAIASAHRNFERQRLIWNAKASGLRPVARLVQTTGELTGSTVARSAPTPRDSSAARCGSSPASSIGSRTLQEPPSTPSRNTRACPCSDAWP